MKRMLTAAAIAATFALPALAEGELNIYNWGNYTNPDLITKFEAETGIKVTINDYDSNDTALAKVKAGGHGFDVVVPSGTYIPIWVGEGLLMETKPNGYLMKPYQEPTLLTTINIALNNFANKQQSKNKSESVPDFIYIKDSNLKVKLFTNDINYIMSDGNYLEIHLEHKKHVIRSKMKDFEALLPRNIFYQCHRRFLVNSSKINALGNDFIQLEAENIPLSSKYKSDLENALLFK